MSKNGNPTLPEHNKKGIYKVETFSTGNRTIIELIKELILQSYNKTDEMR